jgi:hypothetical protein
LNDGVLSPFPVIHCEENDKESLPIKARFTIYWFASSIFNTLAGKKEKKVDVCKIG